MQTQFNASQSVELTVPVRPIPIQHYLRQPQRLIGALVDPSRTDQLATDLFRLKMRPLSFLMLSIQPTVDMRVWAEPGGSIHLQSTGCEIRGIDYINDRFNLHLLGKLTPQESDHTTLLVGRADLRVEVDVPPALWLTPRPLLEATGQGVLHSVLLTIKQRLMHQLVQDYDHWVNAQLATDSDQAGDYSCGELRSKHPSVFAPNHPLA